jgi:hypothetical protein
MWPETNLDYKLQLGIAEALLAIEARLEEVADNVAALSQ